MHGNGKVPRREIMNRITQHVASTVDIPYYVSVGSHDALPMIFRPERFDLLAKFVYAQHSIRTSQTTWHRDLYSAHINAMTKGALIENDESQKTGLEDFVSGFDATITSLKRNGFRQDQSLVPINRHGVVIDGSHRVAAAAALGLEVATVEVEWDPVYDYNFFRARQLKGEYLDFIALKYCQLNERARIALIYPAASNKSGRATALHLLIEAAPTFYVKDIELSRSGAILLTAQIYENHQWVHQPRPYAGARRKALSTFNGEQPLTVIVGEALQDAAALKTKIRDLFDIGNHSIHIADSHEETKIIAGALLNENGVHMLNHARLVDLPRFERLFQEFRTWVSESNVDAEDIAVDGSAVLSAYGIRDCQDLDFLAAVETADPPTTEISNHNDFAGFHATTIENLIYNPRNHFYFRGYKFISLAKIAAFKKQRNEAKDGHDVSLIKNLDRPFRSRAVLLKSSISRNSRLARERGKRFWRLLRRSPLLATRKLVAVVGRLLARWLAPKHRESLKKAFGRLWPTGTIMPKSQKLHLIVEFQERATLRTFVETGTYLGETLEHALHSFEELHSIELSVDLAQRAEEYFSSYRHVRIWRGDSANVLPRVLEVITGPALFWLDAHDSGSIAARGDLRTPILAELQVLMERGENRDVVLIDDAHLFNGTNEYPSLQDIRVLVKHEHPSWRCYLRSDVIVCHDLDLC